MDPEAAERFRSLVADVHAEPPLDEAALLIEVTANGGDVDAGLAHLDEFAAAALDAADGRTVEGFGRVMFDEWRFVGNTADYGDPRNSFLSEVMARRMGLPISLSVLMIEIGRRIGVVFHGVGMPGHFLVGVGDGREIADCFVDPFSRGAILDRSGVEDLFARHYGGRLTFDLSMLRPTSSRLIALRMLTNLQQSYAVRRSPEARWAANLRLAFPELPVEERQHTAEVLASVGAFTDAAKVMDELAMMGSETARASMMQRATAYRSRAN